MTGVLAILYVTNVHGVSIAAYGTLIAIQMITRSLSTFRQEGLRIELDASLL